MYASKISITTHCVYHASSHVFSTAVFDTPIGPGSKLLPGNVNSMPDIDIVV
jgi:hypothetical protein